MEAKTIQGTRRKEIIAAARELFNRKSYHGTATPEIARAADTSTSLIYHTFPSKVFTFFHKEFIKDRGNSSFSK